MEAGALRDDFGTEIYPSVPLTTNSANYFADRQLKHKPPVAEVDHERPSCGGELSGIQDTYRAFEARPLV